MVEVTLSEALAERRRAVGHSQEQAAAEIGVNQSTLSKWLRGVNAPSPGRVQALARYLDRPVDDVVAMVHETRVATASDLSDRLSSLETQVAEVRRLLQGLLDVPAGTDPGSSQHDEQRRQGARGGR